MAVFRPAGFMIEPNGPDDPRSHMLDFVRFGQNPKWLLTDRESGWPSLVARWLGQWHSSGWTGVAALYRSVAGPELRRRRGSPREAWDGVTCG